MTSVPLGMNFVATAPSSLLGIGSTRMKLTDERDGRAEGEKTSEVSSHFSRSPPPATEKSWVLTGAGGRSRVCQPLKQVARNG